MIISRVCRVSYLYEVYLSQCKASSILISFLSARHFKHVEFKFDSRHGTRQQDLLF